MTRQQFLQRSIQKLLDAYVKRHQRIPKFQVIGYHVSNVTEDKPDWATR